MAPVAWNPAARPQITRHEQSKPTDTKDRLRHAARVALLPVAAGVRGGVALVIAPPTRHPSRRLKVLPVGRQVVAENGVAPQDIAVPRRPLVVHERRDIEKKGHG